MRPCILAHRGLSGLYPENTLLAFEKAVQAGCDGIETDVQLSADGEPVIIHDDTLERTTTGSGPVRSQTFKELRNLDAGLWFGEQFTGQKIPHLSEVLALAHNSGLKLNIELKYGDVYYEGLEETVLRLVLGMDMADEVMLSSFDHSSMMKCKQIDARVNTGLLYKWPVYRAEKYAALCGADALYPNHISVRLDPGLPARAHQRGIAVYAWTVDTRSNAKKMSEMGVDGLITNFPEQISNNL
ncbi:MAG: glycerophosphodiester phosphodiesterase [Oscillospiraceae bacterium]|jgi:glycerophosphoryl diester phosphodiesterase|nr:glycerophosphodiester phosphodiesterase [Oscillospiraceae bacterium]